MPVEDGPTGAGQRATASLTPEAPRVVPEVIPDQEAEENLASALSAFLAQLNTAFDEPAPATEEGRPWGGPALARSIASASATAGPPGPGASAVPANRVLAHQPPKATAVPPRRPGPQPRQEPRPAPFDREAYTPSAPPKGPWGVHALTQPVARRLITARSSVLRAVRERATVLVAAGTAIAVLVAVVAIAVGGGGPSTLPHKGRPSVQARLTAAEARIATQLVNIRALDGQYTALEKHLAITESELLKNQSGLSQAQGEVSEAQYRVGTAQAELSQSEARAAQCQKSSALGQEIAELSVSLLTVSTDYIGAAGAGDRAGVQKDLGQLRSLQLQAQALAPEFSASLTLCTAVG